MKDFKKFLIIIIFCFSIYTPSYADVPYYIDFKYILNQSEAGKKAQSFLKSKLENGIKNIKSKENKIQEEEKISFNKKSNFI